MSYFIVLLVTITLNELFNNSATTVHAASQQPSSLIFEAPQSVEFLKRYGYLGNAPDDSNSPVELLFSHESVENALRQAQRFGNINQTGKLDEATKKLFKSKRCGLPDVSKEYREVDPDERSASHHHDDHHHHQHHHHHRHKRFILASRGWNKRHITYYLENWSPNLKKTEVMLEIKKALNAWGRYGQLKFTEVNDPRKSDINFGFYRGDHGDSFPFDGIGQVLAHAFFPSNSDPLRGDVHFDADEDWKINPGEFEYAVDFSTVVLHELGHSLGLSHSPEPNSIMNPYYKGKGFELGYDDILAMYELYASRDIPMEEPKLPPYDDRPYWPPYYPTHERWPPAGPSAVPPTERTTTSRPYYPTVSTTAKTTTRHYPKKSHNDGERRREDVPSKDQPRQSNKDIACQNPNNGIDSAAFLRGELFITKGEWLWRLTEAGKVEKGYPVKFHTFFHKLPESVKVIDALYERHDSSIVFFYGRKYWIFDGYNFIENSPRSIEEYGLREMDEIVDAAFYSPKESLTYIFSGDKYWKYNETSKTVVTGYPRYISHHIKGSPSHLNAALINRNGVVYLFKGDTYWIFDTIEKTAKKMGSVFHHWLSC